MSSFESLDVKCARQLTAFAGTAPKAISYEPLAGVDASTLNCHVIVAKHVMEHGGTQVFGWMQGLGAPGIAEFVFHSVWLNDVRLIDIVPNETGHRRTVFARDSKRRANPVLMDGYNNLLFVSSRRMLEEMQQFDLRAGVELNKLCWCSGLTAKPLSENGKFKQVAFHVDELHRRFGLVVRVSEDNRAMLTNLLDLSITQLQALEFEYGVDIPDLVHGIKANWSWLKLHKDVPLNSAA